MDRTLLHAIKASKIHKDVGVKVREYIKIGMSLKDIASFIENEIRDQVQYNDNKPLDNGIGFPVGLSLNNLAAHYTPNYNDKDIILKEEDILKIDYGVHCNGMIIDSAFTISFNEKYENFIKISRDATNYGVSLCGPDVNLGEIGRDIEEYILSKEIEIDGKIYPLQVMRDLSGHKIAPYEIHAGKAVPNIKISYHMRMKENEFYAIEPFITTGNGKNIFEDVENSHYMITKNNYDHILLTKSEKEILNHIKKYYYTLPFCQKWIYEKSHTLDLKKNINKIDLILNILTSKNILNTYPPIFDIKGSIISQFEHTIFIKENGYINLTKNNYY
jgi:methionyl aminopeptidase